MAAFGMFRFCGDAAIYWKAVCTSVQLRTREYEVSTNWVSAIPIVRALELKVFVIYVCDVVNKQQTRPVYAA